MIDNATGALRKAFPWNWNSLLKTLARIHFSTHHFNELLNYHSNVLSYLADSSSALVFIGLNNITQLERFHKHTRKQNGTSHVIIIILTSRRTECQPAGYVGKFIKWTSNRRLTYNFPNSFITARHPRSKGKSSLRLHHHRNAIHRHSLRHKKSLPFWKYSTFAVVVSVAAILIARPSFMALLLLLLLCFGRPLPFLTLR